MAYLPTRPSRDVTIHMILEPPDLMVRLAALLPGQRPHPTRGRAIIGVGRRRVFVLASRVPDRGMDSSAWAKRFSATMSLLRYLWTYVLRPIAVSAICGLILFIGVAISHAGFSKAVVIGLFEGLLADPDMFLPYLFVVGVWSVLLILTNIGYSLLEWWRSRCSPNA